MRQHLSFREHFRRGNARQRLIVAPRQPQPGALLRDNYTAAIMGHRDPRILILSVAVFPS